MSFTRKTALGIFWVSFSAVFLKIINFVMVIIVVRLLQPEHFGLIAIGLTVINFFDIFRDMGIGAALVYKKDEMYKAANTAFFKFPAAAVIFYIIAYLASSFIMEPCGRLYFYANTDGSYYMAPGWVASSYEFDKKTAFELMKYGKEIAGANVIAFIISIVDIAIIGRLLGIDDLVYYSIAMGIAVLLSSQVWGIMRSVMFPIYSTIEGNIKTLKRPFWKDNKSLIATTDKLYMAAGKPDIRTKLIFIQLILMAALMYPLTISYGILGSSIATMVPSLLIVFLAFRESGKILKWELYIHCAAAYSGIFRFNIDDDHYMGIAEDFDFFGYYIKTGCFYCIWNFRLWKNETLHRFKNISVS